MFYTLNNIFLESSIRVRDLDKLVDDWESEALELLEHFFEDEDLIVNGELNPLYYNATIISESSPDWYPLASSLSDEYDNYKIAKDILQQALNYGSHDSTLIPDRDIDEYCKTQVDSLISDELDKLRDKGFPYNHITLDMSSAIDGLQQDYTYIDSENVAYWVV